MGSNALEVVNGRRSTRKFAPDPVGEADVRDLLEVAMNAPSAVNEQAWQFVVLSSPKRSATPSHLAHVMNLDRSTVTRLISALEKKKLVGRSRSGRTSTISLLEKGSALLPEIRVGWKDLYRAYCVIYGEQEANRVSDLIAKVNRKR